VSVGPDGLAGTADDELDVTVETVAQVQNRVLGTATSAPLYTTVHGYPTLAIRGGLRFGTKHELMFELENLSDANYRGIAWGLDAPGRSISVGYTARF
jgi:outer membrane cobalamin receptor